MLGKVNFEDVLLLFDAIESVVTVNLKGCQPHFLLQLLFKISREQINLKKKLKEPPYQAFTQFNHF